jgi:hypothetical protein
MRQEIDYLNPQLPAGLRTVRAPLVEAPDANLRGYGFLVDRPDASLIEIVRWPSTGKRSVDPDSGDEAGTKEGVFISSWQGDILFGRNEAVDGHYVLGYGCEPENASEKMTTASDRILLWHANYHPDGGQLFYPLDPGPFLVPLALPGDEITPEAFVAFYFRGDRGLYIHPNVWHEGVFACHGTQRFHDIQGAVHARVSVWFADEFECLLEVPRPQ